MWGLQPSPAPTSPQAAGRGLTALTKTTNAVNLSTRRLKRRDFWMVYAQTPTAKVSSELSVPVQRAFCGGDDTTFSLIPKESHKG